MVSILSTMGFFDMQSRGAQTGFQMPQMPSFSGLFGGETANAVGEHPVGEKSGETLFTQAATGVSPFMGGGFMGGAALGGFFSDARLKRNVSRITGALDRLRLL
jgi:hypothetical protein